MEAKKFPQALYNIIESKQNRPYKVMVVNTALQNYFYKKEFPWYLWINIKTKDNFDSQLIDKEEAELLNKIEDDLTWCFSRLDNTFVHYIGRVTEDGSRMLYYHTNDPRKIDEFLKNKINSGDYTRAFEYYIKYDEEWKEVDFFFS
jgi:hypothetical protein